MVTFFGYFNSMNKLFQALLPGLILFSFPACAQTKNGLVKTNSFYFIRMPGTIPVDDSGQEIPVQRDTAFFVYVETSAPGFQWEKAWKDGRSYSVSAVQVADSEVQVGISKNGDRRIVLSPSKNNNLWLLEMTEDPQVNASPQPIKKGEVLLQVKRKGKSFYFKTGPSVELSSPLYQ